MPLMVPLLPPALLRTIYKNTCFILLQNILQYHIVAFLILPSIHLMRFSLPLQKLT